MKWFSERYTYKSDKNGDILVRRILGVWRVSVDNCGQTTGYTRAMCVDAMKRVSRMRPDLAVSSVLMLGLGAAGDIRTLHKQFPNCIITAIEYDPEMVMLAKKLKLYKPFPFPEILLGDASEAVPRIKETFDLIMFDLYHGAEPSPLMQDPQFITKLKELLGAEGVLLINAFRHLEHLSVAEKIFSKTKTWKYRFNNFGAFW